MTYASDEISVDDGEPILFYHFVSNGKQYLYVNAPAPMELNSEIYEPLQINVGQIDANLSVTEQLTADITLPFDCELAKDFRPNNTRGDLAVTIYRAHAGDLANFVIHNAGDALNFNLTGRELTVQIGPSLQNALSNAAGTVFVQRNCNNLLYDARCKVSRAANTTSSTVTGINGRVISVANDGVADNQLRAGQVINNRTGEARLVISNFTNVITMGFAFSDVLLGDTVSMERGCLHSYTACGDDFDNRENYNGMVYLSLKQIVIGDV